MVVKNNVILVFSRLTVNKMVEEQYLPRVRTVYILGSMDPLVQPPKLWFSWVKTCSTQTDMTTSKETQ